jgi:hypothetical protein
MACEALGPAIERRKRDALEVSEVEHAKLLGVDTSLENWKTTLLARARRDYIFAGNENLYRIARQASDAFEHGSEKAATVRDKAEPVAEDVLRTVRGAIIDVLNLAPSLGEGLRELHPIDGGPLIKVIRGQLTGDVADADRLAADESLYATLKWSSTIDTLTYSDDGRISVKYREVWAPQFAPGVAFTLETIGYDRGLNPPGAIQPLGEIVFETQPDSTPQASDDDPTQREK